MACLAKAGCGSGARYTWDAVNESNPYSNFYINNVAYAINALDSCNLCTCTEDGICYSAKDKSRYNLTFIPYCEGKSRLIELLFHCFRTMLSHVWNSLSSAILRRGTIVGPEWEGIPRTDALSCKFGRKLGVFEGGFNWLQWMYSKLGG